MTTTLPCIEWRDMLGCGFKQRLKGYWLLVCIRLKVQMSFVVEFVEGSAQDPCDNVYSICLESFGEDNSTIVSSQLSILSLFFNFKF